MIQWAFEVDPLALWGSGLSTVLALREYLKSRIRIEVSHNFSTLPEVGSEVVLHNISNRQLIIKCWKLVKQKNRFSKPLTPSIAEPDEFFVNFVMPEHSSSVLSFKNQHYFTCGEKDLAGNSIYIYLYIAGKMFPIVSKVYPVGSNDI